MWAGENIGDTSGRAHDVLRFTLYVDGSGRVDGPVDVGCTPEEEPVCGRYFEQFDVVSTFPDHNGRVDCELILNAAEGDRVSDTCWLWLENGVITDFWDHTKVQ